MENTNNLATIGKITIFIAFVLKYGLVSGLFAFLIAEQIFHLILRILFGLRKIPDGLPVTFQKAKIQVVYTVFTQGKLKDTESVRQQILKHSQDIPELRYHTVSFLNYFYYKQFPEQEFQRQLDRSIVHIQDDFQSEQDLIDFIRLRGASSFRCDELQYRILIKKDYNSTQSAVVFVFCHGLSDGIGFLNLFSALQEQFDPSNTPLVRERSMSEQVWRYLKVLAAPYYFSMSNARFTQSASLFQKSETTQPELALSKDIMVDDLKLKICRRLKCSINDLLLAAMALALKQHQDERGLVQDFKVLELFLVVNQREAVKKRSDVKLGNQIKSTNLDIQLDALYSLKDEASVEQQIKVLLEQIQSKVLKIKSDDDLYAASVGMTMSDYLTPASSFDKTLTRAFNSRFFGWTNTNGHAKPLMIGDALSEKMGFLILGYPDQSFQITILSHNGYLKSYLYSRFNNFDPQDIMQNFDKIIETLIREK
ncbi:UNKNOWN [Stylonychia lemnae]|uniref:O-acyltransferase WSD1 C-terminal domain-containing protein n=1 Tax=Stylonychia lemnae TaxID=5949 RepID=A0A078A2H8_STYLE|nr:UNKNOWN [Stylonychia lemnae]|eukprot:CDW76022.1 UNKNOWN [Stylonychia lemnae]